MSREIIVLVNSSRGKVVKPIGQKARCYRVGGSTDYVEFDTLQEALVHAKAIHKGILSKYLNTWRTGIDSTLESTTAFTKWRDTKIIDSEFFN